MEFYTPLKYICRKMTQYDKLQLDKIVLFKGAAREAICGYLDNCTIRTYSKGEIVLTPEQTNSHIFIILSGSLQVHLDTPENTPFIQLAYGECVGEMSLIEGKEPSAFVLAAEETELLVIDHVTLWLLIKASHSVAMNLLLILSGRLRHDNTIIVDVMEARRQAERFSFMDPLTGLHNRRWMNDIFPRQINRCRIDGLPLALIMMDLDHFKKINDTYGHLTGDTILRAAAKTVLANVRPNDQVVRYGGEEFAILLPETSLDKAMIIAERLRNAVANCTVSIHGKTITEIITASFGISAIKKDDVFETILARADCGLLKAKESGRNRCVTLEK